MPSRLHRCLARGSAMTSCSRTHQSPHDTGCSSPTVFDLTVTSLLSPVLISEVLSWLAPLQLLSSGNIACSGAKCSKLGQLCSSGGKLTCSTLHLAIQTSDNKAKVFSSLYSRLNLTLVRLKARAPCWQC